MADVPVTLGDEVLFRVDSEKLARAIEARVEKLLEDGADPSALKLVNIKAGPAVYWGKLQIVVVTADLARASGSQPKALAAQWLARLRQVAEVGLLKLTPSRLDLPVGGEASVEVSGLARGGFLFNDGGGRVQLFEESSSRLRVQAKAVGKARVLVGRGKARAVLTVQVKDLAGRVPEAISVKVAGDPAPGSLVTEALLRTLQAQSKVNPGCRLQIELPASYGVELPSVPQGQRMTVQAIARISGGEDYYPVRKEVQVAVESLDVDPIEPNLLLVSNRPEQVDQDGVLLEYTLTAKEPSRLMYSHMNASEERRRLWINLINPTEEAVQVLLDWSFAGPARNEVSVGHAAAQRFLQRLGAKAGYVLDIPARSRLELAEHDLARKELLSGFAAFRLIAGSKLDVQVMSKKAPGRNDGSPLTALGAPFNPFKIHPHGVFAQPYFEEWLEYAVGTATPLGVTFGESPWLIDFESGLPNTGNFGVVYRWHVQLTNPTTHTSNVGLFFTPRNGAAALSLLLNRQTVSIPFTPKNQETPVRAFRLEPGKEMSLDLTTLPEASSSYPAHLEFRELRPGDAMPEEFRGP